MCTTSFYPFICQWAFRGDILFLNWSLDDFQCFKCTAKWFCHAYICVSILFQAVDLFSIQLCVSVNPKFLIEPQMSHFVGFPGGSNSKESTCSAGNMGSIPGSGRSLEEGMATRSNILAWRIPWTEEPGGLHPWHRRVGHDWATFSFHFDNQKVVFHIHQSTSVS